MDKVKGLAKGGWHPSGDRPIHRDTWKSDIKGMATGKKKDPYEYARNHQSAPLSSLKDPDSFGPPPKHRDYYPNGTSSNPSQPAGPSGGWGTVVPAPQPRLENQIQDEPPKPPEPYRIDTTGLRTDNLPKPPARRNGGAAVGSPVRNASPSLPPRHNPAAPSRQAAHPPPILPPRMNDHPDEHTPAPPPSYPEATQRSGNPAAINVGAANRLGQAGISVPGFGIGSQPSPPQSPAGPTSSQLSELQQRFSRMNAGSHQPQPSPPQSPASIVATKKHPPPPPPKKPVLGGGSRPGSSGDTPIPPPIPSATKPRLGS
ncbi:hypothetical protein M433DRAFT_555 [Acidomyces richmondensis BFW]|nr:MAG: hypothetical protein FE78DRAFT_29937 [Acidomyces sp. 'richmondensis']KYG50128.1 hypothetical protein M433DRAFT_555 [Acidomyces richmondensis BFW]